MQVKDLIVTGDAKIIGNLYTNSDVTASGGGGGGAGVTYSLSKSGSTITLNGSDGTSSSVTDADSNTTYSAGTGLGLSGTQFSVTTVPVANGGTGANDAAGALTNLGLTATAGELNYIDGVTSNVQTQLNNKLSTTDPSSTGTFSHSGDASISGQASIGSLEVIDGAAENGDELVITAEGLSKMNASANIGVNGVNFSNGDMYLNNAKYIFYKNASGTNRVLTGSGTTNNVFFGYGSYTGNEGTVYYDGNAIEMRTKGAIAVTSPTAGLTSRQYGVNKVLWSGGLYMNASQTATLSEAINAQPHGIVLVWSWYDGQAYNNNWNSFFVPKSLVTGHSGTSFSFFIVRAGLATACQKSLMISTTSITGVATNNQASSTGSSITNTPNNFVLRYVIGV